LQNISKGLSVGIARQRDRGLPPTVSWCDCIRVELGDISRSSNGDQVVAYAGMDLIVKESGKYKGQTKLSKRGSGRLQGVTNFMTHKKKPALEWYLKNLGELDQIKEADFPLAIKLAIKELFIYVTKAKAWRADTRKELVERYKQATALVGPGEIMIQQLIPGDGRQQSAYYAFFKNGQAIGSMVAQRRRQHPPEFGRASTLKPLTCPC
jgi:hypothetical protein